MTSHSFHRSTAEVRAAFIGFLEDGESRPILDTAALGPFYRLSCWGIGGSSHSDCLTYCSQSGPSHCASQQSDTATRATSMSGSNFLPFRTWAIRRSGPVLHPHPEHVVAHAVGSCHGWLPRRIFWDSLLLP